MRNSTKEISNPERLIRVLSSIDLSYENLSPSRLYLRGEQVDGVFASYVHHGRQRYFETDSETIRSALGRVKLNEIKCRAKSNLAILGNVVRVMESSTLWEKLISRVRLFYSLT